MIVRIRAIALSACSCRESHQLDISRATTRETHFAGRNKARDVKDLHIVRRIELFQPVSISVFCPVCGSPEYMAVLCNFRGPHVHYVLVVFKQGLSDRGMTWIGTSNNEYANITDGLAVRRRLAECGRQGERWDDEPLS